MNTTRNKVCLKSTDHQDYATSTIAQLRDEEDFFDVTLVCDENYQIEAHKVILSAYSQFFNSILKKNKNSHPLIYIKGSSARLLNAVIDFIYKGEVNIFEADCQDFIALATDLNVKGLECIDFPKYANNEWLDESQDEPNKDINTEESMQTEVQESGTLEKVPVVKEYEGIFVELLGDQCNDTVAESETLENEIDIPTINFQDSNPLGTNPEESIFTNEFASIEELVLQCDQCQYISDKPYNLERHRERHTQMEELVCKCFFCNETFDTINSMKQHMKSCKLKCKDCTEQFKTKTAYKLHIASHFKVEVTDLIETNEHETNNDDKTVKTELFDKINKFICNICNYMGRDTFAMKEHNTAMHERREEPLVCSHFFCQQSFETRFEQKQHQKQCVLTCCDKHFVRSRRYEEHRRSHKLGESRQSRQSRQDLQSRGLEDTSTKLQKIWETINK